MQEEPRYLDDLESQWMAIDWEGMRPPPPRKKSNRPGPSTQFMDSAVESRVAAVGYQRLLAEFEVRLDRNDDVSEFDYTLGHSILDAMIESGDRQAMVDSLAVYFPEYFSAGNFMEYYLVNRGEKLIEDPVLVLFDAYELSHRKSTRQCLLKAVRRAFPNITFEGLSVADYLAACRKWYTANSRNLSLNVRYNRVMNPRFAGEPLFELGRVEGD